MAVNLQGMPFKGPPFIGKRLQVLYLLHPSILLELVIIHDDGEIIQPVVSCIESRFPDLSLIALPISGEDIDTKIFPIQLGGQGHADPDRNPLSQRPSGGLDTAQAMALGVALERAVELPEGHELLNGEVARTGQRRIKPRGPMPLA